MRKIPLLCCVILVSFACGLALDEWPASAVLAATAQEAVSLWPTSPVPTETAHDNTTEYELGLRFQANIAGSITAIRYYRSPGNKETHTIRLWDPSVGSKPPASATSSDLEPGWKQIALAQPIALVPNRTYIASYHTKGNYAFTSAGLAGGVTRGPLTATAGIYADRSPWFPVKTSTGNYWIDVVFVPDAIPTLGGPTLPVVPPALADETSTPNGRWKGQFEVDSNGSPSYRLPLWVPPGRAGMEPEVALEYHGNAGYGTAGMGWSVSGFSRIERCRRVYAIDGAVGPIRYDATDKYCLDGQRLVPVTATASHGGQEFRTDRNSFARIVAYGPAASFTRFEVETADGRTKIYSTMVGAGGGVASAWLINRVQDGFGNAMEYDYTFPAHFQGLGPLMGETVEAQPWKIRYTSFSGAGGATLPTTKEVELVYDATPLPFHGYVNGRRIQMTRRLTGITVRAGGSVARRYNLGYDSSPTTARPRVRSVQQCDGRGVCLPAIRFDYNDAQPSLSSILINHNGTMAGVPSLMDMNGDGRADLVYEGYSRVTNAGLVVPATSGDGRTIWVRYADPAALAAGGDPFAAEIMATNFYAQNTGFQHRGADLDGNGSVDLLFRVNPKAGEPIPHWFKAPATDLGIPSSEVDMVADYDGDGLQDIAVCYYETDATFHVHLNRPSAPGTFDATGVATGVGCLRSNIVIIGPVAFIYKQLPLDVDGDGKSEIVQAVGLLGNNTTGTFSSTIARFDTTSRTFSTTPFVIAPASSSGVYADMLNFTAQPGDFNGDGLGDLYSVTSSPSDSSWFLTGAPADSAVKFRRTLHNRGGFDGGFWVDDFNNDGISDLLTATNCRQTPSQVCSQFRLDLRGPGGAFLTIPGESPHDIIPGREFEAKNTAFGDVDGDGTPDILAAHVQNGGAPLAESCLIMRRQRPDLLEVVREDAVNESYRIRYEALSNRQAYQSSCTLGTAAQLAARTYPRRCLRGGNAYVVKEYLKDAGPGFAPLSYQYQYENSHIDLQGLGFLGFEKITIDEPARMQKVQLTYDLTRISGGRYPYLGMVKTERRATVPWTGGAVEMTFTEHELATRVVGPTYFPYVRKTVSKTYVGGSGLGPNGPFGMPPAGLAYLTPVAGEIRSITVAAGADEIDDYGNEIGVLYDHFDGETKTVRTDYLNDVANWTIRRPLWQITTQRVRGGGLATVNTNRTWNVVTGALRTSERDLLSRNVYPRRIETNYEPDIYGNVVSVTDRDAAGSARATSSVYDDPEHMYPQSVTNAAGHVVQQRYHAQLGTLVISVGSNGETTRTSYDGLGRLRKTEHPNGTIDETEYLGAPSTAGNVTYSHLEHAPGQPDKRIDFDRLDRPIVSTRAGFDGTALIKRRTYDQLGRLATESLPAVANAATTSWRMAYSNLDRMTSKTSPDGQVTSYSVYEWFDHDGRTGGRDPRQIMGRVIQQTNPRGLRTSTFVNGQGHVEQVIDQRGNITRYGYGPFGPETVTDARGNVITVQYDLYGRRRELIDPDMGTRTYTYTTFGEPYTEVDANGNTTTFTYDVIGRRTLRVDSGTVGFNSYRYETRWTWDTAPRGIGYLASSNSPDGVTIAYTYDGAGREDTTTETVAGTAMVFDRDYDPATGFLRRLSYPRTRRGGGVAVTLDYQNGKLRTVRDAGTNSPYWERLSANALGETTLERYGNKVETTRNYYSWGGLSELRTGGAAVLQNWRLYYDGNRNVTARVDVRQRMTEQFGYDGLDRVTQASFVQGTAAVLPTTPLPACNPPNTAQPPTFARCATTQYDEIGNITYRSDVGFYSYGAINTSSVTRAHAVSNIQWVATNRTFRYDPNGNALSNGKEAFIYTVFGKPRTITGADATQATFQYDAEQNRARQQVAGTDMLYASTLYQRETAKNGTVTHRYFIEAEGRVVAEVATVDDNRPVLPLATTKVSYYHEDFLGSIEVVTDNLGNLESRRSNDVFGRIRSEDWRAGATAPPAVRRRGYTGHEEDYRFGLVNMKGRLYDPYAARMLQPDLLVSAPLFSQSLNRYSYVWNNPLALTDPTGLQGEASTSTTTDSSYESSYDSDVSTPEAADPGASVTCYVGSPDPGAPKPETASEGEVWLSSSDAPESSPDDLMSKDPDLMATQYSETVDSAPLLPNIPFTSTSCTVGTECANSLGTLTIGLVGSLAAKDESPGEAMASIGTGYYWDTDSGEFGSYKVVATGVGVQQETGASVEFGWFNSANDFSGNTVAFGLTGAVKGKGGGVNLNFSPDDWHVQGGSIDISLTGPNKLGGTIQTGYTILNPLGNDGCGAPSYPPGTFLGVLMPQPVVKVDNPGSIWSARY